MPLGLFRAATEHVWSSEAKVRKVFGLCKWIEEKSFICQRRPMEVHCLNVKEIIVHYFSSFFSALFIWNDNLPCLDEIYKSLGYLSTTTSQRLVPWNILVHLAMPDNMSATPVISFPGSPAPSSIFDVSRGGHNPATKVINAIFSNG